ncbi:fasciclin domain-containing protein [Prolixibacteraceae bacterium]|nr:fasciclin domain-containing protein [Prolixibacteraceae bacterium]
MKKQLIVSMITVLFLLFGCKETFEDAIVLTEDQISITEYLELHPNQCSSWLDILERSGLADSYRASGLYTVYIPSNDGIAAWLEGKNIDSLEKDYLQLLVKNHTLGFKQLKDEYRQGTTKDTNLIGRNMSIDFKLGNQRSILLNKKSLITEYDIKVSNGYINIIDQVLELKSSLSEEVGAISDCSIFTDALKRSGFDQKMGDQTQSKRKYYTMLVETNELLKGYTPSINSVDDLIDRFSDSDDLTSSHNGFNRWVAYHIINGTQYTNNLLTQDAVRLWTNLETQYKNHAVEVLIEDRKMFFNKREEEQFTQLDDNQINIPAANGCIHLLKQPLHITKCRPTPIEQDIWDVLNLNAIEDHDGNHNRINTLPKNDHTVAILEDVFDEIDWGSSPKKLPIYFENRMTPGRPGTDRLCYTGGHGLNLRLGDSNEGWVRFKTPYLAEGTYRINCYGTKGPDCGSWDVYVNGKHQITNSRVYTNYGNGYGFEIAYGIFLTEGVHTITIKKNSGNGDFTFGGITYNPLNNE